MSENALVVSSKYLPLLVADLGGTNVRFAFFDKSGNQTGEQVLTAKNFPNFPEAVLHYLQEVGIHPAGACLAVAAPILGDQIQLTNREWQFSVTELKALTGIPVLEVINDFKALSMALPYLGKDELDDIGNEGTEVQERATKLVLGPGTGLGVASLIATRDGWTPLPGEGGHSTFSPTNDLQRRIQVHLGKSGHVSYEDLLSGPGLVQLYRVLRELGDVDDHERTAPQIMTGALSGEKRTSLCLNTFCEILGSFAGDLALINGAHGGVYLGGGIVPRMLPFLKASKFRENFEAKGRMQHFVKKIPTYAITAPQPTLTGAAAWITGI